MKVKLELTESIGKGEWKHVMFAWVDTKEGQVEELLSWLNHATRRGFWWERADEP